MMSAVFVEIRMTARAPSASFQAMNVPYVRYQRRLCMDFANLETVLGECNHSFHMVGLTKV